MSEVYEPANTLNIQDEPEIWEEMSAGGLFVYFFPSATGLFLTIEGIGTVPIPLDFLKALAEKHPEKMITYNYNHYRSLRLKVNF